MTTKATPKKFTTLTYGDFTFEATDTCHDRFDLFKKGKNQKTGKDTRSLIGYGYTFEEGIEKMIRTDLGERGDITDIKGYVAEYKKAVTEVKSILK